MLPYKVEIAEFVLRSIAGILFLFQGYDKLFNVKIGGVVNTFLTEAENHHIHRPMLVAFSWATSIMEFVGGILLLLGLFTDFALYILSLDLILAVFAFSVLQAMWDMRHVFPRMVLIVTLLLLPAEWNKISLDFLFKL